MAQILAIRSLRINICGSWDRERYYFPREREGGNMVFSPIKRSLVERGDGSYDSTGLFLYIRQPL
jgi:hypothetical protein